MDKQSAVRLIQYTFQNPFEKNRFIYFTKNLLNSITPLCACFPYKTNEKLKNLWENIEDSV